MNIRDALDRAAHYLAVTQLPSGGFESKSSPRKSAKHGVAPYQTTFFPSLILDALNAVDTLLVGEIKDKVASFLIEQKSSDWSFNYWDRHSLQCKLQPYPDDLDDTFCALAALYGSRPNIFTPTAIAHIAKLLISVEAKEGGPYKTWLTTASDQVWRDVDIAVNANVGYFLSLQKVDVPSITQLVEMSMHHNRLRSPYYPNRYPIIYFIARWYRGDDVPLLIRKLLATKRGVAWQHPQRTALAVTSLLRLGYPSEQLASTIDYLLHLQQPNGSWEAEAFCVDPSITGKVHYGSSRALATALCMEVMSLYAQLQSGTPNQNRSAVSNHPFYESVVGNVKSSISRLNHSDLQTDLHKILTRTLAQDKDRQIILLPLLVSQVFAIDPPQSVLKQLATASLWGWMAYGTYDDFLDGDSDAHLLPAANVCLRSLTQQLAETLPTYKMFKADVADIMDRLDAANAWEMAHCRGEVKDGMLHVKHLPDYGDYWQLADRSLGHSISALGVLYATKSTRQGAYVTVLKTFFRHYLIARQLNDDAHGWYADLSYGHINSVAAKLLHTLHPSLPQTGLKLDLNKCKPKLEQLLWEEVIDVVCHDIQAHADIARACLRDLGDGAKPILLEKLLQPIEQASRQALQKRNEALEFIGAL